MIANNIFKKSMSIKILIPAKIKLRGEEIGRAFRSIIYDKLKKNHHKKDNNFGYVKSIDPNIEMDEQVLVKIHYYQKYLSTLKHMLKL